MSTLKERIEAAKERERKAIEARKALERKAAEGPKRQARRDVTEVREIMLAEEQLRGRYHVGYSGLAEIVRRAKKEGVKPVVATGQRTGEQHPAFENGQHAAGAPDSTDIPGFDAEHNAEAVALAEEALPSGNEALAMGEQELDPRDEPPLGDEPVALPDPEPAAADLPW